MVWGREQGVRMQGWRDEGELTPFFWKLRVERFAAGAGAEGEGGLHRAICRKGTRTSLGHVRGASTMTICRQMIGIWPAKR